MLSPTLPVLDGDASIPSQAGRIGKAKAGLGSGARGVRGDARKTSAPIDSMDGEDMLCKWRGNETSAMVFCAQNCSSSYARIDWNDVSNCLSPALLMEEQAKDYSIYAVGV